MIDCFPEVNGVQVCNLDFFLNDAYLITLELEMKIKNLKSYNRSNGFRDRGPRNAYNFGFDDETGGFARVISEGRLIEKTNRRKIFFNMYY